MGKKLDISRHGHASMHHEYGLYERRHDKLYIMITMMIIILLVNKNKNNDNYNNR